MIYSFYFLLFIEAALHNTAVTNEMDASGLQKKRKKEKKGA